MDRQMEEYIKVFKKLCEAEIDQPVQSNQTDATATAVPDEDTSETPDQDKEKEEDVGAPSGIRAALQSLTDEIIPLLESKKLAKATTSQGKPYAWTRDLSIKTFGGYKFKVSVVPVFNKPRYIAILLVEYKEPAKSQWEPLFKAPLKKDYQFKRDWQILKAEMDKKSKDGFAPSTPAWLDKNVELNSKLFKEGFDGQGTSLYSIISISSQELVDFATGHMNKKKEEETDTAE